MSGATILIVDDEAPIRDMIRMGLEMQGFNCLEAADGLEAHAVIVDHQPDLILLDWMMPNVSGLELIRRLKKDEVTASIPVIMLTAKAEEDNMLQGLQSGADDYVRKPFSTKELVARVRALLRRSSPALSGEKLVFGPLVMDQASHRVKLQQQQIDMGPTEYRLLHFFMTHPERAYSRGQLLDHVWGGNVYVEERTVDVHIRRLRKALEAPVDVSGFVQTVRGTGYRFSPEAETQYS
ncbi:MAG: phosphate regulon transcriptional regulator PhoB [Pseudomonadales bacterium]